MNEKKKGTFALFAICIAIFVPNFAQYQLSPMAGTLMQEFAINESQFSTLFTSPMIPAIFLSLCAGVLVDRFEPKYVIGIAVILSCGGALMNVFSSSYAMLVAGFIFIGITAGFLNSTQAKLIGAWFPPEKVGQKMGISMAFSTSAMAIALATTPWLPSKTTAFLLTAALSVLSMLVWWVLYPKREDKQTTEGVSVQMGVVEGLKKAAINRSLWIIGVSLFLIMGANVVMGSFVPSILEQRGVRATSAGLYTSVYTIGSLISCFLAPVLAEKLGRSKRAVLLFCLVAFAGVSFAWRAPEGILMGLAFCITGMAVGGNMPILMSLPIRLKGIGPALAGTAGGFIATIQLIGAVVLPSYVLSPVAGGSLSVLFLLAGICMACTGVLSILLPSDI